MTGYEIDKIIVTKFGIIVGPCKVYNTLIALERNDLITCIQNRQGRTYCLTEKGLKAMANLSIAAKEVQNISIILQNNSSGSAFQNVTNKIML